MILFWHSLKVTFYYSGVSIPLGIIASFILALLLNGQIKGVAWFRTAYYVPSVISGVAVGGFYGHKFSIQILES